MPHRVRVTVRDDRQPVVPDPPSVQIRPEHVGGHWDGPLYRVGADGQVVGVQHEDSALAELLLAAYEPLTEADD